jgi:hypothetical protein
MKVVIAFDFSDAERAQVVRYYRARLNTKGLPRLATRELLRDFINEALDNQWLGAADTLVDSDGDNTD